MYSLKEKYQFAKMLRGRMTKAETLLWKEIKAGRLHGLWFDRQEVICGFIVDFVCYGRRLVIEVDGASHRGREFYDFGRTKALNKKGLEVLRFRNEQVEADMDKVLDVIAKSAGVPDSFRADNLSVSNGKPIPRLQRKKPNKRKKQRWRSIERVSEIDQAMDYAIAKNL